MTTTHLIALEWSGELGKGTHVDADNFVKKHHGWRLPTEHELLSAYVDHVSGFENEFYWSSTKIAERLFITVNLADGLSMVKSPEAEYRIRLVRNIRPFPVAFDSK